MESASKGDVELVNGLTAFLSSSAEKADREIVEWFLNLLKEYKIEPVFAADRPEPRPPQEKIEDFIRKSDMLIAVITRRDRIKGRKNLWKGPAWVQNEIAMAYALKKPIAIFVEEGVQLDPSMGPFITDCVRFDRRDMTTIRKKAENYVEALCKEIHSGSSRPVEDKTVDETIVEEVEEGAFGAAITRIGRAILLWRYGKLNVSLRVFYAFTIPAILALSYIGYDSLFGTKILGPTVASVVLVVAIILFMIVSVAVTSRCKKCGSYFSRVPAPITYGDMKRFPSLPQKKMLLKYVCKVCGNTLYETKERDED
ncbi:toll/interleukin-1 receptor domain-containing protein [Candidatus Bathyarchaeota archaeon]|nr:toll/interleukin-1 receptor domain-containing protein [Candidatus Bathyarchaeota archaeon]